jgi:hypothetical protein
VDVYLNDIEGIETRSIPFAYLYLAGEEAPVKIEFGSKTAGEVKKVILEKVNGNKGVNKYRN